MHFYISNEFWGTGVRKISKNTPTPNFGEILLPLCCPTLSLDSQLGQIFKTYFDPSQDVFETPSPWLTFFQNSFYEIFQKPLEISKKCMHQIWRYLNFTSTRSPLFFDIFNSFRDIMVQRISKITPIPKLWGNIGLIVLAMGGFWFEANCSKHRNFHSNRSTCSYEIFTDKLFRPDRRTHPRTHVKLKTSFLDVSLLVESGNVLRSTSNLWRYSNTSIRSTNMEVRSK